MFFVCWHIVISPSQPLSLPSSLSPVVPWAVQSWANYDIRIFANKANIAEQYANTEHAICVLNHRGDMDWMIGWCFIERGGMLGVICGVSVSTVLPRCYAPPFCDLLSGKRGGGGVTMRTCAFASQLSPSPPPLPRIRILCSVVEDENSFDRHAVAVLKDGRVVGHIHVAKHSR